VVIVLQEGDAVTVVIERSIAGPIFEEAIVCRLEVGTGNDGFTIYDDVTHGIHCRLSEEGVWWIRGHHEENAPEMLALRAALALVGSSMIGRR
jgi:hypothetical protein